MKKIETKRTKRVPVVRLSPRFEYIECVCVCVFACWRFMEAI